MFEWFIRVIGNDRHTPFIDVEKMLAIVSRADIENGSGATKFKLFLPYERFVHMSAAQASAESQHESQYCSEDVVLRSYLLPLLGLAQPL